MKCNGSIAMLEVRAGNALIALLGLLYGIILSDANVEAFYYGEVGTPSFNEVHIGKTAVVMPLGYYLLARKDGAETCAIIFKKFWTSKTESDMFADYESHYQNDKTGAFSSEHVIHSKQTLSFPKPFGIGRFAFSFGNKEVTCGSMKLFWSGNGAIHFYAEGQMQGEYGIELAPTNWTDISQVNVFDPLIKWYRYDGNRKRVNVPIGKIFDYIDGEKDEAK